MSKYNFNKEEVYDLYINKNYTLKQLSEYYNNVPIITLQRFLRVNEIKKNDNKDYSLLIPDIQRKLNEGMIHKDIAKDLGITIDVLRHIIYKKINPTDNIKYSNKLTDESWIIEKNYIFWYIVGLVTTDGHIDNNGCICIFQSNFEFLKNIQKFINHCGRLYKNNDSECYTLMINSPLLYDFFVKNGFSSDKRYDAKFIIPSKEMFPYYLRGIFDGDGCLYYRYISGTFEGKNWQITSGSKFIAKELKDSIKSELNIDLNVHEKLSQAGNSYYDITTNNTEDIIKICEFIYINHNKLSLTRKFKSYIKLKSLIKLDKQINDIVDASVKTED